jgi:hypothetical protein
MMILGIAMALLSAFTLAISMNVQEYALTAAEDQRLIIRFGRNPLWVFGLVLYLVAQGFFVVALSFLAQTLVSALFAYCLIFNALISHFIIGIKQSTQSKIGLAIILLSLTFCGLFSPTAEYDLDVYVLEDMILAPTGYVFWSVSAAMMAAMMYWVTVFEKKHPLFGSLLLEQIDEIEHHVKGAQHPTRKQLIEGVMSRQSVMVQAAMEEEEKKHERGSSSASGTFSRAVVRQSVRQSIQHVMSPEAEKRDEEKARAESIASGDGVLDAEKLIAPSQGVEMMAMCIYPVVLGMIEMVGQCTLKASLAMLTTAGETNAHTRSLFYIILVMWASAAACVVIWLKKVYSKFATTQVVPPLRCV